MVNVLVTSITAVCPLQPLQLQADLRASSFFYFHIFTEYELRTVEHQPPNLCLSGYEKAVPLNLRISRGEAWQLGG